MFNLLPRFLITTSIRAMLVCCLLLATLILKAQQDSTRMRFDFGWTRNKNIYLWPLYKRTVDSCSREREVLFPVYKTVNDRCDSQRTTRILPFLISDNTTDRRDVRIGSLYYPSILRYQRYYRGRGRSLRFFELLPHFNFYESTKLNNGGLVYRNALFLFWYKRNIAIDQRHIIVLPLLYNVKSGKNSCSLLFPLYYRNKNEHARHTWIAPLLFLNKTSRYSNGCFFPVVWWHRKKEDHAFTFFPLMRVGSEHSLGRTKRFWNAGLIAGQRKEFNTYFFNPESRDYAYDSLYKDSIAYERHTSQLNKAYFFPFWIQRSELETHKDSISLETHSRIVFPFYWRYKSIESNTYQASMVSYDTTERLVLFPVYWNIQNPDNYLKGIFPLYVRGGNTRDSSSTVLVTPLLWFTKVHNRREHSRGINLLPFYYQKKTQHYYSDTLYKEQKHHILFPIIWRYNTTEKNGNYSRSFVLFPLVWKFNGKIRDVKSRRFSLFPVYWRENSDRLKQVSVFPLFSHKYAPKENLRKVSITPFFRIKRGDNTRSVSLFPLYFSSRNTYPVNSARYGHRVIFPLCWHYWNEGKWSASAAWETKGIFPLFWKHKANAYESTTLFPLYYRYETATDRSEKLCWLLYTRQRRLLLDRTVAAYGLYYKSKFSNHDKIIRIGYKLYSNVDRNGYQEKSIFPIYHYTAHKNESESTGYFLNFYNRSSKKITGHEEYYREVRIFWFIRILSNYRYLESKGLAPRRR